MRTLLVTTIGAIMLASGGMSGDQAGASAQNSTVAQISQQGYSYQYNATADVTQLPEYETLAAKIDLAKYSTQIAEDNSYKRVILLKDENGQVQFKSMFIKKDSRLKVVDYKGGLIFNQVIDSTSQKQLTSQAISNDYTKLPEYKKLSATNNLSGYTVKTVEDNPYKRILLFKDASGHAQFKTIYIKKTGEIKLINL